MLFTSYSFIFFLILLFTAYYTVPKKFQWKLLLIASFVFYGLSGPKYLLYISATILSSYFAGRKLDGLHKLENDYLLANKESLSKEDKKSYKASAKSKRWKWLLACLLFNFGILAVIKYADFAILNVNTLLRLTGSDTELAFFRSALPLGISFYTFQTMGYIIDVYRGKYPAERNALRLALFVSFFPQVIQGPISRFDDLKQTLFGEHEYDGKTVSFGLQRVLLGFFKKLVIADRLLIAVRAIVENTAEYQGVYVLIGIFFYAVTLYCDFTGGIDITIGVAEALGIKLKENFDRPFYSKSITEYWRRWHISMGTWFKDYLFYPISVCKPMLKLSKRSRALFGENLGKRVPVYLSTIVVWFATGIWHGASWNFIVWGLTNGIVIIISQELSPLYAKFHKRFKIGQTAGYQVFRIVRTFWLMSFIRTFDCYGSVGTTFRMFGTIVTDFSLGKLLAGGLAGLGLTAADYAAAAFGVAVLLVISFAQRSGNDIRETLATRPIARYAFYTALIFSVVVLGVYGIGYDAKQFIYNQF